MIEVTCCTETEKLAESMVGEVITCPACGKEVRIVSGEPLASGAGEGDFDAALVAAQGTTLPVSKYVLGGVADIEIGKLPECQIVLQGQKVSRHHCKLVRVDFGPSRWKIVDNKSTNGLFVNKQRVSEKELADGDRITIGEFNLKYSVSDWTNGISEPMASPGAVTLQKLPMGGMPLPPLPSPVRTGKNKMGEAGMVLGIIMCIFVGCFLALAYWVGQSLGVNTSQGGALGMYDGDRTAILAVSIALLIGIPLLAVLALVLSILGLLKSRKPGGPRRGQAIAGLVIGICGLILVCAFIPSFYQAREHANRVKCVANIHRIGDALAQYAHQHQGELPSTLDTLVSEEGLSAESLKCPDAPSGSGNYVLAGTRLPMPRDAVVIYEPLSNHGDGIDILYGDGSIKFEENPRAQEIITDLENGINPPRNHVDAQSSSGNVRAAPPQALPRNNNVNAMPANAFRTNMIGGNGGQPYVRIDRDKKLVVGFAISTGSWSNHKTISQCDPLWSRSDDSQHGDATICMAREGYAVGGIIVNKIDGADGLQIIFMKLTDSGVDPNDSYNSPWFGDTGGGNRTQLAGHGERVIGTFGRQGNNMDAIGLVTGN